MILALFGQKEKVGMKKNALKSNLVIAILVSVMLMGNSVIPASALTATGVLEEGEDYIHFDVDLAANITKAAFNMTKRWFEENREEWSSRWNEWRNRWEERHREWRGKWKGMMEGWREWARKNTRIREEWQHRWEEEWGERWEDEWADEWEDWEEWMENWEDRWEELVIDRIERIPRFMESHFRERMRNRFEELWERHMNAPRLAECWLNPASRLGFRDALGRSLNRTLQWVYNTTDVYVRNFTLAIEVTTKTFYTDDTYFTSGLYDLQASFDLYGVVIRNETGTFIRSQFRHLNVTEKVDGGEFGYHGWVFVPSKSLFMDLTAFSLPLENWERAYDEETDTTTFTLVKDINVTTPYGNVIIDPEMNLVVPGQATAAGEMIAVTSILPSDLVPVKFVTAATVVATIVLAGYYLGKRRTAMTIPTSLPA